MQQISILFKPIKLWFFTVWTKMTQLFICNHIFFIWRIDIFKNSFFFFNVLWMRIYYFIKFTTSCLTQLYVSDCGYCSPMLLLTTFYLLIKSNGWTTLVTPLGITASIVDGFLHRVFTDSSRWTCIESTINNLAGWIKEPVGFLNFCQHTHTPFTLRFRDNVCWEISFLQQYKQKCK